MSELTISAKNLGRYASDEFCPRCEWLRLRLGSKLPFQSFPGIFSSIDSYTKKILEAHNAEWLRLPDMLGGMLPPHKTVSVHPAPHWSKYRRTDPVSGVTLQGSPDFMFSFEKHDGSSSYVIADYKTARLTEKADLLSDVYRVQLNSYGWIGVERWHPADSLFLIYYEPVTEIAAETSEGAVCLADVLAPDHMALRFKPKWKEVPIDQDEIARCLLKVRELSDTDRMPSGRPKCKECGHVDLMVKTVQDGTYHADLLAACMRTMPPPPPAEGVHEPF